MGGARLDFAMLTERSRRRNVLLMVREASKAVVPEDLPERAIARN